MAIGESKRAAVLKRLLPFINRACYFEWEDVVVFGSYSLSELIERLTGRPDHEEDPEFWEKVRRAFHEIQVNLGRKLVADRASLEGDSAPAPSKTIQQMTPDELQRLIAISDKLAPLAEEVDVSRIRSDPASVEDSIDAALSEEMVGKLSKAVDRAARLTETNVERVPDANLRRYFLEAHRCYLYGFDVACAVLCRAILESALKAVCDPRGKVEVQLLRSNDPKKRSYYALLVEAAAQRGLFGSEASAFAEDVRRAGGHAIHNFSEFEKRWGGKMELLLYKTRLVLIGLFGVGGESKL